METIETRILRVIITGVWAELEQAEEYCKKNGLTIKSRTPKSFQFLIIAEKVL